MRNSLRRKQEVGKPEKRFFRKKIKEILRKKSSLIDDNTVIEKEDLMERYYNEL